MTKKIVIISLSCLALAVGGVVWLFVAFYMSMERGEEHRRHMEEERHSGERCLWRGAGAVCRRAGDRKKRSGCDPRPRRPFRICRRRGEMVRRYSSASQSNISRSLLLRTGVRFHCRLFFARRPLNSLEPAEKG